MSTNNDDGSTPLGDGPVPDGTPLGANYRLFDVLGRGAMGEVRRGRTNAGDAVAVKILRPELSADQGMVARFLQESHILVGLDHPNIVRVRDLVAESGRLAIVMDLVEGPDLRTELKRRGTLPPAEAAALTAGVLRGLSAIHAAGVVHRDIKPENVLLDTTTSPTPTPKITDFGVSKLVSGQVTSRSTSVIGTPEYMAPELIDDVEPTVASDLYSVGVMLYALLCGVTPFAGGSPLAVLRKHAEFAPGRIPGLPDPLWSVVSELMAKSPAARPTSAALVASALESMLAVLAASPALPALSEPPAPDRDASTILNTLEGTKTAAMGTAPKKRRGKLFAGIAAVVVLLAGGGTAAAVVLGGSGGKTQASNNTPLPSVTDTATDQPSPTDTPTTDPTATPTDTPSAPAPVGAGVAVLPSLTGKSLSDATAALTPLGVSYDVKEVLDSKHPDNTVLGQTPAAGTSASHVTLTVSRVPVATYLADIGSLGDGPSTQPVQISGTTYAHALSGQPYCNSSVTWEYDLGKSYRKLDGLVGLTDSSDSSATMRFEITADGRQVFATTAALGKPHRLSVDLTGVLRLQITTTSLTCGNLNSSIAMGDPRLLGVPSEVPSASPTP
jgi:serine/threonine protein kinase